MYPCLQDDLHCIPPVNQLLILECCQHGLHKLQCHAQLAALVGCGRGGKGSGSTSGDVQCVASQVPVPGGSAGAAWGDNTGSRASDGCRPQPGPQPGRCRTCGSAESGRMAAQARPRLDVPASRPALTLHAGAVVAVLHRNVLQYHLGEAGRHTKHGHPECSKPDRSHSPSCLDGMACWKGTQGSSWTGQLRGEGWQAGVCQGPPAQTLLPRRAWPGPAQTPVASPPFPTQSAAAKAAWQGAHDCGPPYHCCRGERGSGTVCHSLGAAAPTPLCVSQAAPDSTQVNLGRGSPCA